MRWEEIKKTTCRWLKGKKFLDNEKKGGNGIETVETGWEENKKSSAGESERRIGGMGKQQITSGHERK